MEALPLVMSVGAAMVISLAINMLMNDKELPALLEEIKRRLESLEGLAHMNTQDPEISKLQEGQDGQADSILKLDSRLTTYIESHKKGIELTEAQYKTLRRDLLYSLEPKLNESLYLKQQDVEKQMANMPKQMMQQLTPYTEGYKKELARLLAEAGTLQANFKQALQLMEQEQAQVNLAAPPQPPREPQHEPTPPAAPAQESEGDEEDQEDEDIPDDYR